jgi:hypothetical protein
LFFRRNICWKMYVFCQKARGRLVRRYRFANFYNNLKNSKEIWKFYSGYMSETLSANHINLSICSKYNWFEEFWNKLASPKNVTIHMTTHSIHSTIHFRQMLWFMCKKNIRKNKKKNGLKNKFCKKEKINNETIKIISKKKANWRKLKKFQWQKENQKHFLDILSCWKRKRRIALYV